MLCFFFIFTIVLSSLVVTSTVKPKAIAGVDDWLWIEIMKGLGLGAIGTAAGLNSSAHDGFRDVDDFDYETSAEPETDDYKFPELNSDEILANAKYTQQVMLRNGDTTPAFKIQVGIDDYLYFLNDAYADAGDVSRSAFEIDYNYPDPTKMEQNRLKLGAGYTYGRIFSFRSTDYQLMSVYYIPIPTDSSHPTVRVNYSGGPNVNFYCNSKDIPYSRTDVPISRTIYCIYRISFDDYLQYQSICSDPTDAPFSSLSAFDLSALDKSISILRSDFPLTIDADSFTGSGFENDLYKSDKKRIADLEKQLKALKAQGQQSITTVVYPDRDKLDDALLPALGTIPKELEKTDSVKVDIKDKEITVNKPTTGGNTGAEDNKNILDWLTGSLWGLLQDIGSGIQGIWDWLCNGLSTAINSISSGLSSVWEWCKDFWNSFTGTVATLFVPRTDYWDDKPSPSARLMKRLIFVNQIKGVMDSLGRIPSAPLKLSFEWFDFENIYKYPNTNKTRTYTVDFSWYDDYKNYIRGGLALLFIVLAILGVLRILFGIFGVGLNSAPSLGTGGSGGFPALGSGEGHSALPPPGLPSGDSKGGGSR